MMSICCPSCGSLRVVARNHGRKIGGAVGAVGLSAHLGHVKEGCARSAGRIDLE